MLNATKVIISTSVDSEGDTYLCYEPTTPPWEVEGLFHIKDKQNRSWFCHESNIKFNKPSLEELANKLKKDYAPITKESAQRRIHNPLIIQIALCRVNSIEKLTEILSSVQLNAKNG